MKLQYILIALLLASSVQADIPRNTREFRILHPSRVVDYIKPHDKPSEKLPKKDPSRVYYGPEGTLFPNLRESIERGFPNYAKKIKDK